MVVIPAGKFRMGDIQGVGGKDEQPVHEVHIKRPLAAAIAAMPIPTEIASILAATGIGIAIISCYAETRGKLRQAKSASPYHYLIGVADEFSIQSVR